MHDEKGGKKTRESFSRADTRSIKIRSAFVEGRFTALMADTATLGVASSLRKRVTRWTQFIADFSLLRFFSIDEAPTIQRVPVTGLQDHHNAVRARRYLGSSSRLLPWYAARKTKRTENDRPQICIGGNFRAAIFVLFAAFLSSYPYRWGW